jgi:hypothetical protein
LSLEVSQGMPNPFGIFENRVLGGAVHDGLRDLFLDAVVA